MALNKVQGMLITIIVVVTFFASGLLVLQGIYDQTAAETGSVDISYLATTSSNQSLTGTTQSSLVAQSKNDTWMSFDGVNDYVNVTDSASLDHAGNLTLSVWVNSQSSQNGVYYDLISKRSGGDGYAIALLGQGSNQFSFFGAMPGGSVTSSTSDYSVNEWYHVLVKTEDTNTTIYVNGVLEGNGSIGAPINNAIDLTIGGEGLNSYLRGSLDEIRVYDRALSSAEIAEVYASGRPTANASLPSDELVAWYSFNEGEGTTLYDKSGEDNNGI